MKRRVIIVLMLMLAITLSFAQSSGASSSTLVLRVWHGYSQKARIDAMNEIGRRFTEKTGIKVEYEVVTWPNQAEKWRAAFAAKAMPDVMICLPDQATSMYFAHATVPANDAIKLIGGSDKFLEGALKEQYYKGNYIGVPHYAHSRLLIYRKDALAKKSQTPPLTMQDYLNVSKAINDPPHYAFQQLFNKSDYGSAFMLDIFMRTVGARYFDKDFNIVFNSPETIKAVKFLIDMYKVGSMPNAMDYMINDQFTLLNTGATLMTIDSAFTINNAVLNAPQVAANLDVAEPPSWYITTFPIVIGNTPNIATANKFVAFLFEEDNYVYFLKSILPGMNPTLKSIIAPTSSYWKDERLKDPLVKKCVELQNKGIGRGWSIGFEYGVNPFASVATSGYVEEMFHQIITNGVSVEKAVADCARKMQAAVDEQKEVLGWK
jgi:multiple sugar transport system substrate-binding protein